MENIYITIEGTKAEGKSHHNFTINSNIERETVPLILLNLAKQYYEAEGKYELKHQFVAAPKQEESTSEQLSFDL